MLHIQIQEVRDTEMLQLAEISKQTFLETFADANTKENMDFYVSEKMSVAHITKEYSNRNSKFYFALIDDCLAGYLKLNFNEAQTEIQLSETLEIERLYVLSKFQGKKLGDALMGFAMEIAISKKVEFIWLGVWEKNEKAIQFYTKHGFKVFDHHIFALGDDAQTDLMMKKEITHLTQTKYK